MDKRRKQSLQEAFGAPYLTCPECSSGSGEMAILAARRGEWANIHCSRCNKEFLISRAIDEMFLDGVPWGYAFWAGYKVVTTVHELAHGETAVEEIRGEFESSYDIADIQWGPINGGSWLAGGATAKFVPQGYMLMALAPWEERSDRKLKVVVNTVGRRPDGPDLPAWKETLLRGRILGQKAPAIAPVLAVAGLDLYVESVADKEDYSLQEEDENRPGCWRTALDRFAGINLRTLEGGSLRRLQQLAELRNRLAHGRDYMPTLPQSVRDDEQYWQAHKFQYQKDSRLTPAGEFALRITLNTIRRCRLRLVQSRSRDKH